MKINQLEMAQAVIAHEAVPCFLGKETKPANQPAELVSCTGGVFWGKPGETWPCCAEGAPLIPWLQIVCGEMKNLAGAFFRRKSICFYLKDEFSGWESLSKFDLHDFVVREYFPEDELVPLLRPVGLERHRFHRVKWEASLDYPCLSKYYDLFEDSVYTTLCKKKRFPFSNKSGIKIGGWPTPIQGKQQYPTRFNLQIDMTENFMYADSGIGFLSKHGDQWYLLFECC